MAHHSASIKSIRQDKIRHVRNRSQRSALKTLTKKVLTAPDTATAEATYKEVSSLLDKMARKNVIHPNKAANQKSRLALFRNKLAAKAS